MSELKFVELKCQRCGGLLEKNEEYGSDTYVCQSCGKTYEKTMVSDIADQVRELLSEQQQENISNLKQQLWRATHEEYVSNIEVIRICNDILKYDSEDFYANFYLATCSKKRTALGDFLFKVDITQRYDDIPMMLDYLLRSLKSEWSMAVADFIERAYKDNDLKLCNKYHTEFEKLNDEIEEGIFEPSLPRDVFVAYSSADMPEVERLVAALEEADLTCFVAARNLRHGSGAVENYANALHAAIDNCSVLVFISSENSRSFKCDAYKELSYINRNCSEKPRVEYLIKNYSKKAAERFFTNFFDGLEYCTTAQDVAERVLNIIMSGPQQKSTDDTSGNIAEIRQNKLKRVFHLINAGEFENAKERLEKIEQEEEERTGDCEIAEIYHYKMLLEYNACTDDELISCLAEKQINIIQNKNFRLARSYAEDCGDEEELNRLIDIKNRISERINKAKEAENKKRRIDSLLEQAKTAFNGENYDNAVKQYNKIIELCGDDYEDKKAVAEQALKEVTRLAEIKAQEEREKVQQLINSLLEQAGEAYKNKDYESAVKLYTQASELGSEEAKDKKISAERKAQENARYSSAKEHEELRKTIGDFKDIGDGYVTFGAYPQSKKAAAVQIREITDMGRGYYRGSDNQIYAELNGSYYKVEPIIWKVLRQNDGQMLIAAENILDAHRFNERSNNYEKSEIRKWLNCEFFEKAFTDIQQEKILITEVDNGLNSTGDDKNEYVCDNTNDKIFLLSRKEAIEYFSDNEELKRVPTAYAVANGVYQYTDRDIRYKKNGSGCGYWWLRSPYSGFSVNADYVNYYGNAYYNYHVSCTYNGICPALIIKI